MSAPGRGPAIGIDLGTTNTVVATIDPTGRPEVVRNSEGQNLTPSVVLVQSDGGVVVGGPAMRLAMTRPQDVVERVKRHMGEPEWRFESGTKSFGAEEISARILRKVAQDAAGVLGAPVTSAVITVPAYFDDSRRQATKDAGRIAGLEVLRIINEPTAAALAYGLGTRDAGTCLVYDLGGGTFDATVLRISGGAFTVLSTDGDRNLGGFEFDNRLMNWVNEQVVERGGEDLFEDERTEALLRDQCVNAKHLLSQAGTAPVFVDAGGQSIELEITRELFAELTADLITRTTEIVEDVLKAAGLAAVDLDEVLLVGGSTRMAAVGDAVERVTGRRPDISLHPDEAVAKGAAVQAELLAAEAAGQTPATGEVEIADVTSHGLGVIAMDADKHQERNFVILPANTPIPERSSQTFYTVEDGQTQINVRITQGDEDDPRLVKIITKDQSGVPLTLPPYPEGSPVEVHIAFDFDGTIHVEVTDLVAGVSLGEFPIDRAGNLSTGAVEQMARAMRTTRVR